ncbi:MAG TPA: DUF4012 domain-containing protein [Acidimicrobiales bacterium]
MALAAAVGGAFAQCHPTGTHVVDPVETAVFAAFFTVLVARVTPIVWVGVALVTVALARGTLLAPAGAVVALAAVGLGVRPARRWVGPLIGALGVQVILRWPPQVGHGFSAAVAGALVVACGPAAWRRSSRRTRRRVLRAGAIVGGAAVLFTVLFAVAVALVRHDATRGEAAARSALSSVGSGSSTSALTSQMTEAATDTAAAAHRLAGWLGWGALGVPVVAQQQRFAVGALRAASSAAQVAEREAPAVDYRLDYADGQVDLAKLEALATPMRVLDGALRLADTRLGAVGSPWLVAPLADRARTLRTQVTHAAQAAGLATQAARVLPGMLGANGTRHYLVAFMTPAESRGYDGLIGSYGVLTADAGHLELSASGQISDVQNALPPGGATLTGVPGYLARYGSFDPGEFPQDAAYSPDLPTDAKVFAELYGQSIGGPVDGVLAVDPAGLAALLHFTGPVSVPGLPTPLDSSNATRVLLSEQYTTFDTSAAEGNASRQDFLLAALHTGVDALLARGLPAPQEISSVLDPAVRDGRIGLWSFHAVDDGLLARLGVDGRFPSPGRGDLLAVTTANTGNNKIDAYLHTTVDDQVEVDPGTGSVRSSVTVSLENAAPASGLPGIVIDSPADPALAPGVNETWLTVYSPLAFNAVHIDGAPATMSATRELGVWAYSTYVEIPPGATSTVRVELSGTVAERSELSMGVRLQPAAHPVHARVTVGATGGWAAERAGDNTWDLGPAMRQQRTFRFVHR